jgi:hypothetical protein
VRRFSLSAALGVLAALGIVPLLILVVHRGVELPYWDEWEWTDLIYEAHTHTLTLARLWLPHNEHRIFIPNVLMLALDAAGGWSVVREQVVSLIVLLVSQACLWLLIRRTVRAPLRGVCFFVCTVLLLGLAQYENLFWGFQMGWFITDAGLIAAVWALTRPRRTPGDVAIAMLAATVASLSLSQGVFVWLAGLVVLLVLPRRGWATIFAWLAAGAIVAGIARYGSGQVALGHVGLTDVPLLAKYVLIYLGTPLAMSFGLKAATWAGVALVAWSVILAAAVLRRGGRRLRVRLAPWIAIWAYVLVSAAVTATARAGFGVEQAGSSRYVTVSSLAWIAVIAATFAVARPRLSTLRWAAAPAAAVVAASLVQSHHGFAAWKYHQAVLVQVRAELDVGNSADLKQIYPIPARVTLLLGELGKIHDGLFSDSGPAP